MNDNVAHLLAENAFLKERIAILEKELKGEMFNSPPEWKLTWAQDAILGILLKRSIVTTDVMEAFLYSDRKQEWPSRNNVRVLVFLLRKKLREHGIEIVNHRRKGYQISDVDKRKILQLTGELNGSH